ncbi:MAG: helix-turn-helix domain-containing protein [Proteobacteria bacterium]|jgi:putative molybdopterin biosynthesis protein|nr:helix-turn-helix domain-containing protein [Pseudomonadota bacterium]
MAEYLTTKEVAKYLRLNEKKVYALVAQGRLPAARISGKWLFPKHLVDQWVEGHTIYPESGLMGALLKEMVVLQGSDDWLLSKVVERFHAKEGLSVVSANVGSMGGLSAIASGQAHLAGCHVANTSVRKAACRQQDCYLVNLFERHQGLIFDGNKRNITELQTVVDKNLRFAIRQPASGTYGLVKAMFEGRGLSMERLPQVGPFNEHLGVAMAIRKGRADAGVAIRVAAEMVGLQFLPLQTESYKLAIPSHFLSQNTMTRFLDFILEEIRRESKSGLSGYEFNNLGSLETIRALASPTAA